MRVVLQEEVYCRKTVLQYSLMGPELYCKGLVRRLGHNTKFCIATVGWARCWHWSLGAQAGRAGQAARRAGRTLGATRHGGCRQRARGRAEQAAAGARGPRKAGRRRWACAGHAVGGEQALGARGARDRRAGWP